MIKEERLNRAKEALIEAIEAECDGMPMDIPRKIADLVRAVREDERKLANEDFLRDRAEYDAASKGIAAAIRRRK